MVNFDLVHMLQLTFEPAAAVWVHQREGKPRVCVSSRTQPELYFFHNDSLQPVQVVDTGGVPLQLAAFTAHTRPVYLMALHPLHAVVVTVDVSGVMDYWSTRTFTAPAHPLVSFHSKLDTDLYTFARLSLLPSSLSFSHSGALFVTTSADRVVRLWRFSSGRVVKQFDDSLAAVQAAQASGNPAYHLDAIDFGRRLAVEREMEKAVKTQSLASPQTAQQLSAVGLLPVSNAVFDDSDTHVLWASLVGVKVVNVHSNLLVRVLGKGEAGERFTSLALYQGLPVDAESAAARQGVSALVGGGSATADASEDPTLFALSYRRDRFFFFSQREPDDEADADAADGRKQSSRDVLNERPQATGRMGGGGVRPPVASTLPAHATVHTTMGDIHLALYPALTPRTYENFTTHARRGYYNGCIFHRVIAQFMIQVKPRTSTTFSSAFAAAVAPQLLTSSSTPALRCPSHPHLCPLCCL